MITELTESQKAKIPEYVDKWVKIGFDTNPFTEEKAHEVITDLYKAIFNLEKPEIVIKDSPKAAWDYICSRIGKEFKFYWPYTAGQFDANIFAFYDYCIDELKIYTDEELKGEQAEVYKKYHIWRATSELSLMYCFDDVCIVSQKPVSVKLNAEGLFHCDNGPAVEWADGFALYNLNGVKVPKEYACIPWNELDPAFITKETNAEVRRELVRKIGIERIIDKLGGEVIDEKTVVVNKSDNHSIQNMIATMESGIIDKELKYELLLLDIGDNSKRPYLKMINPSIGTYHIEGVHPDCKTVDDALAFRNGTKKLPDILT